MQLWNKNQALVNMLLAFLPKTMQKKKQKVFWDMIRPNTTVPMQSVRGTQEEDAKLANFVDMEGMDKKIVVILETSRRTSQGKYRKSFLLLKIKAGGRMVEDARGAFLHYNNKE